MNNDNEQLNLLAVFHYVLAGLTGLVACLPLVHLGLGIAIVFGKFPVGDNPSPPPEFMGWILIVFAGAMILIGWAYAICLAVAGRFLYRRKGYLFCLVMAGLTCLHFPIGTCLGVFTLIVMMRPSVKSLFDAQSNQLKAGSPNQFAQ